MERARAAAEAAARRQETFNGNGAQQSRPELWSELNPPGESNPPDAANPSGAARAEGSPSEVAEGSPLSAVDSLAEGSEQTKPGWELTSSPEGSELAEGSEAAEGSELEGSEMTQWSEGQAACA